MQTYEYSGNFDVSRFREELLAEFPEFRIVDSPARVRELFFINYLNNRLLVGVPDGTDATRIQNLFLAHDPLAVHPRSAYAEIEATRGHFQQMPQWATWTPEEAESFVQSSILNGDDQAALDVWIESSVTNLAGARTALKQIAGSLIAIRTILTAMAKAIIYLRDIAVRS